jgi:hypothetical protein
MPFSFLPFVLSSHHVQAPLFSLSTQIKKAAEPLNYRYSVLHTSAPSRSATSPATSSGSSRLGCFFSLYYSMWIEIENDRKMTNLSYKEVVQFAAHRLTKATIKKKKKSHELWSCIQKFQIVCMKFQKFQIFRGLALVFSVWMKINKIFKKKERRKDYYLYLNIF